MKKIYLVFGVVLGAFFIMNGHVVATESDDEWTTPEIYIKAINPGYVVNGVNNVGEMIEIARRDSDTPILLAGTTVSYTNSSGNTSVLYEFPEHSWMTGESILLRLASSPGAELAAINYTKTLAFKAGLEIWRGEEKIDEACWTGKEDCAAVFKSSSPTTLVRNEKTGVFEHRVEYVPTHDDKSYYVEEFMDEGVEAISQCKGLEFSELLSYYETSRNEQFIEFHNNTAEQILLDGCQLRYKNKLYKLSGIVKADEYIIYTPELFSLTKNPANNNLLELVDTTGAVTDSLRYPNGQKKGASYAWVGYDKNGEKLWRVTYAPTPGTENNYQEFKTCEAGKVINEATGNCVKVATVSEKVCAEGQYLNILTGRCKKIEVAKTKTCKEGYYLNPETNRCRKIKNNDGADYNLATEQYEEKSSFVALYAVLGVVGLGLIYLIYEFRKELWKLFDKVFRRFR